MTARIARQAPFLAVWAVVAIGFLFVAASFWRRGLVIVAAAAVLACLLRLVLPARRAGWLVVRSRPLDVLCFGSLGVALGALTLVVPAE